MTAISADAAACRRRTARACVVVQFSLAQTWLTHDELRDLAGPAMRSNPIVSSDEFMSRTPPGQKEWKIVPVGPRPFPPELRGAAPVAAEASPVPLPVAGIAALGLLGIGAFVRRRRNSKELRG